MPAVAPLGLEYVANSLAMENMEFEIIDLNFEPEKTIYDKLKNKRIELVGITIRNVDANNLINNEFFIPKIKRIISKIKKVKHDCPILLGGAGFSALPSEILEYTGADFGVVGYGEEACPSLIKTLRKNGDLCEIKNLIWRSSDQIITNALSKGRYQKLPFKKRNFVRNIDYYKSFGMANIEIRRGCPMQCAYCVEPQIVGCSVVTRKIDNIILELKELIKVGITNFCFSDSEFNMSSIEFNRQLCEAMIKHKLNMTWVAWLYPDKKFPLDILNLMHKAGCREIALSLDSGSDKLILRMSKHHTSEDSIILSENIKKAGLRLIHNYLIGLPGESRQTIDKTIELIKQTKPDVSAFFVGVRIYPNTKVAEMAIAEGQITSETNLLKPHFYNSIQVSKRFLPYLIKETKGIPGCIIPSKFSKFRDKFIQNVYLSGYQGSWSGIRTYMSDISPGVRMKIICKTIVQFIIPGFSRFLPVKNI